MDDIIFVMEWRIVFLVCEVFFIKHCACSSKLSPPRRVNVRSSVLTWDPPVDHTGITYAVQYNTTLSDWSGVYNSPQRMFNFTAAAEDFYGKRFRVRSERGNQTSDWEMSKLVQCAHLHTCAPIIELKVETDKVHLLMKHRDQSVKEENGRHISFKPLYWKRNGTKNKRVFNSDHLVFKDLESGEEYCFQVEYLLYEKPHGKPSREVCTVIPETSKQRNWRVIMFGVLTLIGLAIVGSFLYFFYTHHKRIKALLQPPLDIPEHFEEFLFSDFPQHPAPHPVTESYNFVSLVEEVAEDQDRRDLENDVENASST